MRIVASSAQIRDYSLVIAEPDRFIV